MKEIIDRLFEMQDLKYKEFQANLTPNLERNDFIGVRTPALRAYAKELKGSNIAASFLKELPHKYFEENQLHAFLIETIKDYDTALSAIEAFLPYVDNWATCDQMKNKVLKKQPERLYECALKWMHSEHTYTIRYGIEVLMNYYLDELFDKKYLEDVAAVKSEEYYVNMMIAWYFATALAKQYDSAVKYIEEKRLDDWTHKKTISKACESFRVSDEHKCYLKQFR